MERQGKSVDMGEITRYILNGLLATAIHYGALSFNLHIFDMQSAGLANFIAAIFGITASFLGSRYFVFKMGHQPVLNQAMMFLALYISIACLHGLILYGWTDVYGFDYRIGFLMAMILQVTMSYWGNKSLVFKS